jgi:tetratricopeptide (TPR) repeat protein
MSVDILPSAATGRLFGLREARTRVEGLALVALGGSVAGVAASHGGYFPTSWGWTTLGLLCAAAAVLLVRRDVRLGGNELAFLAAVLGFVVWIGLSIVWSTAPAHSVSELERALVYLAGALAFQLAVTQVSVSRLLAGLLAGTTLLSAAALAGRLFPDRPGTTDPVAVYRLSEPVGYWNALGILAAIGALLALGFAARGRPATRALAAAAAPILLAAAYFTFSRGAWAALAVGLAVAVASDRRRLQLVGTLLAFAPAPALAVWLGSRSSALTTRDSSVAAAAREGHRLALWIALLACLNGVLALALTRLEPRIGLGRRARRVLALALAGAVVGGGVAVLAASGGPEQLAHRGYRSFAAPPNRDPDLTRRLLTLSSNGRIDLWRVAGRELAQHPWLGGGAGSYEQYWHRYRTSQFEVRDAHSLYLETLAELGPVGLALLALALALPGASALRGRARPLVPCAFGAYVAFLVHAGVDWDWEMPAIVLAGLGCAAALLASGRGGSGVRLAGRCRRVLAGALLIPAAIAALGLVGNRAAATSAAAAAAGDWPTAESEARKAERWAPWSPRPWVLLGDARFAQGDFPAAARYYRRAIAKDSGDWNLWFDLGFALEGRPAASAFARAAELDPLNPEIAKARAALAAR